MKIVGLCLDGDSHQIKGEGVNMLNQDFEISPRELTDIPIDMFHLFGEEEREFQKMIITI